MRVRTYCHKYVRAECFYLTAESMKNVCAHLVNFNNIWSSFRFKKYFLTFHHWGLKLANLLFQVACFYICMHKHTEMTTISFLLRDPEILFRALFSQKHLTASKIKNSIWRHIFFLWRYSPNSGLGLHPWNSPFYFSLLDLRQSAGFHGRAIS
jgi:hypothetical protein